MRPPARALTPSPFACALPLQRRERPCDPAASTRLTAFTMRVICEVAAAPEDSTLDRMFGESALLEDVSDDFTALQLQNAISKHDRCLALLDNFPSRVFRMYHEKDVEERVVLSSRLKGESRVKRGETTYVYLVLDRKSSPSAVPLVLFASASHLARHRPPRLTRPPRDPYPPSTGVPGAAAAAAGGGGGGGGMDAVEAAMRRVVADFIDSRRSSTSSLTAVPPPAAELQDQTVNRGLSNFDLERERVAGTALPVLGGVDHRGRVREHVAEPADAAEHENPQPEPPSGDRSSGSEA